MTRHLMTVTASIVAACGGYHAAQTNNDRRRSVGEAILAGREPDPTAAIVVAEAYRVVAVSSAGGVNLRDVELRLQLMTGALVLPHRIGLVALLPADAGEPVAALVAPGGSSARVPFAGISELMPTGQAPVAFEQARMLCRLSTLLHRPLATLGDVLFEYLVVTQEDSHPRLRAVAAAIAAQPALASTYRTYERCASNQLATARELGVHRNTVTYRLGRIAAVTGHDPTTVGGARVVAAALLLAALDEQQTDSTR